MSNRSISRFNYVYEDVGRKPYKRLSVSFLGSVGNKMTLAIGDEYIDKEDDWGIIENLNLVESYEDKVVYENQRIRRTFTIFRESEKDLFIKSSTLWKKYNKIYNNYCYIDKESFNSYYIDEDGLDI